MADDLVIEKANLGTGVQFYAPERWGVVESSIANPGTAEASALVAVNGSDTPMAQYCTRVWVPAGCRRIVVTPFLPEPADSSKATLELQTRLIFGAEPDERAAPAHVDRVLSRPAKFDTAELADLGDDSSKSLIGALRQAAGLKPSWISLDPAEAPPIPEAYEAVDTVFITRRSLDLDPRHLDALRRWLVRGGRIWIMLDRVGADGASALLQDRGEVSIIDTVEVTRFKIDGPSGSTEQKLDYGVPLVRVCAPGFEVVHRIDGNPASMRKRIGRGEVVVTTLAARGWLDEKGAATASLSDLQSFIVSGGSGASAPGAMAAFDEQVREAIGYRVLDRGWVVVVLGASTILTLGVGAWLSRRGRLEFAAPVSAVCAAGAAGVLIAAGMSRQTQTPSTVASGQLILCDGTSSRAEVMERMNIYTAPQEAGRTGSVTLSQGGALYADRSGIGSLARFVWRDPWDVSYVGLDARSGAARALTMHGDTSLPSAPRALIGFGATGVEGKLEHAGLVARDQPIVITPAGCVMVHLDNDGTLTCGRDDVVERGEFGTQAVLNQQQMSRQNVLRGLLSDSTFPAEPALLLWTDAVDAGIAYRGSAQEKGTALLSIPLSFLKPQAGARVTVPGPLMSYRPVRGHFSGRASSTAYDPESREWLQSIHQPMLVVMAFRLPPGAGRLTIDSAVLMVDLRAPGREYDVVTVNGDRLNTFRGRTEPIGRVTFELSGDRAPVMQEDGSILVGIDVKDAEDQSKSEGWSVRRMELSVTGRAQ